jgi:hypothetical protein
MQLTRALATAFTLVAVWVAGPARAQDTAVNGALYCDNDGDGWGGTVVWITTNPEPACSGSRWVSTTGDCNDNRNDMFPGNPEFCDGRDNDCDGIVDDGVGTTWYRDADGDGYGSTVTIQACSRPPGYASQHGDCNDANPGVHPGAAEVCNGVDDDCDNVADDGLVFKRYYPDSDGDSYGAPLGSTGGTLACSQPAGTVLDSTDCNDSNASIHPNAPEVCNGVDDDCDGFVDENIAKTAWHPDFDGDTYGNGAITLSSCFKPVGYVASDGDCNDTNASIHPNATEVCNGKDDDCDNAIDEGLATTWYRDADGDRHGDPSNTLVQCASPSNGYVAVGDDCDDANPTRFPGNPEICDGFDNDCDTLVDEGVTPTWYPDDDLDGYGASAGGVAACTRPPGTVTSNTDCDDGNLLIHPNAPELCNGVDDDCDGQTDENLLIPLWFADDDADGFGSNDPNARTTSCTRPIGYAGIAGDCDDADPNTYPNAQEICDGKDNDCDGTPDDGTGVVAWYKDGDGDGYGDGQSTPKTTCAQPAGYVLDGSDCDDADAGINPGAVEVCNLADDDCDAAIDEGTETTFWQDLDSDSWGNDAVSADACTAPTSYVARGGDCDDGAHTVNPGATEACNGVDDDCDGLVDEGVGFVMYADLDADGYGDDAVPVPVCSVDTSGLSTVGGDCDDGDPAVNPGAIEVCDGEDEDCNGLVDDVSVLPQWYADADGDGFGDASGNAVAACAPPLSGAWVQDASDCDDADAGVNPAAEEICDGVDDDCDGGVDEGLEDVPWWPDADGDGFGDGTVVIADPGCRVPPGGVANGEDCDDGDAGVHPGAADACDGVDDDCDGTVDEDAPVFTAYTDADDDGFGDPATAYTVCTSVSGMATVGGDCDDRDAAVNPAATESCDGLDDDCDGEVDEGLLVTWWTDADGDGYGDGLQPALEGCAIPSDGSAEAGDCDDADVAVNPAATEVCDGVDDDCDNAVDEELPTDAYWPDVDADGFGDPNGTPITACGPTDGYVLDASDCDDQRWFVFPESGEICDGLDDDCNGLIDDGFDRAWYADADGDGYGDPAVVADACDAPEGYVRDGTDCDDTDPDVWDACDTDGDTATIDTGETDTDADTDGDTDVVDTGSGDTGGVDTAVGDTGPDTDADEVFARWVSGGGGGCACGGGTPDGGLAAVGLALLAVAAGRRRSRAGSCRSRALRGV